MYRKVIIFLFLTCCLVSYKNGLSADMLLLRDNLQQAKPGDYLVMSSNKTYTLMHMRSKQGNILTIEEIAVPEKRYPSGMNWKEWVQQQAPGNTSWVMYDIDLQTGQMLRYYSFTKQGWFEIAEADNFLSKLLNLKWHRIPLDARKKVGPKPFSGPDFRPLWQPRMVVEGRLIKGVPFEAWQTKWPRDNSDLSGKTIEIYLPQDNQCYPSYFPYWLQINGVIGKAKIRLIDSGNGLKSPKSMSY